MHNIKNSVQMMYKLKNVYFFLLKLFNLFVSIINIILFAKKRTRINSKNCYLPNHSCATCLANGPSAKHVIDERYDLLMNTDILVLNNTSLTSYFWTLKPRHYIILDPMYFVEGFTVEHEREAEGQKTKVKEENEKIMDALLKVDWEMNVFLPANNKANKFAELISANSKLKINRYNATKISGFDWFVNWCLLHRLGLPCSKNVVIPALVNLINLNYDCIYLYGVEMSWTKTMDVDCDTGLMFFNDQHFYSKSEIRYFEKGAYNWWLKNISEVLTGLEVISRYAIYRKVKIINRTKGSFVDSFEYENIDTI